MNAEVISGQTEPVGVPPSGRIGRIADVWLRRVANVFSGLAGVGILIMVLATVFDVIARSQFGGSLPGVVEYSEVALVVVTMLGMMGAQINRRHVQTPMLTNRLKGRTQHVVRLIGMILALLILAWIVKETADVALHSIATGEYRFGASKVPVWPARLSIPIGLFALLIVLARDTWHVFQDLVKGTSSRPAAFESTL